MSEASAENASAILQTIQKEQEEQLKSITVEKDIDLEFDVGNLLVTDTNPLDVNSLRKNTEQYILNLARDNAQLLFNEIWKLPVERVQDSIIVKLPEATTVLPREKRIPKPKPMTKWQQYAQIKGIKKRKRGAMIWDEKAKDWKPRFGFKRANDETKEWVLEIPNNADPYEDQFEKKAKEKRERVAKNELQRLRNIARRTGKPIPGAGQAAGEKQSSKELESAFHVAKRSTASLGQFEPKLKSEKAQRNTGKKRKFEPVIGGVQTEKARQLSILNDMSGKNPKLNTEKIANRLIQQDNQSHEGKKSKGKSGKKQRKNVKFNRRSGGKGKRGKGKR